MLNRTQALSEATLNDYLTSLKKMEAYGKKFDSSRLPIVDFTESIKDSVERAPAWVRQMIIRIEETVDTYIRGKNEWGEYDYSIDLIYDVSGGGSKIGGNLWVYYYPRIADKQCFLDVMRGGWDSTVSSVEKHNFSRIATELFHNEPHGFDLTPVGRNRHQIFVCKGFKGVFDCPSNDEVLSVKTEAAKFLESGLQLFLAVVSGSFDYVERTQIKFSKGKSKFTYEIRENPEYKFPWGEGMIMPKSDGTVE